MQKHLSRQRFLALAAFTPLVALEACKTAEKTAAAPPPPPTAPASTTGTARAKPPALTPDFVKEFVSKSHSDLARVKELYAQDPGLLNASWDWGGGDFETGLEAAGHVGNRDIALFLIEKGARMNVFCAAMLGRLDILKAVLGAFPELKNSKGPHGLMLKHHATKGGKEAKLVLAYLEQVGAS